MENSYKFFSNKKCEYFPCHKLPDGNEFNCLFCYCPLYSLGDKCGGTFEYQNNIKDCTDCHLPHMPEYYDIVIQKLSGIATIN
ncbi:MAG: cysteine-rich small domain-containing protein [Defluviitaleaceae bacterium]|nr:cysteine-rich small domain-containing protein [Defluviitaleaceae bacterium]